ncbi:hypothetical protein Tco_1214251 [Tanacetum coccineum]
MKRRILTLFTGMRVEDGDDGDIYDIWDITVSKVEWIMQFLTPNVPDVMDDVIHPLILKTLHTTPPDEDYVATTTKSNLDELLEELGDEILNVTMVDEEADFNPTYDIEELERLLAKDPQSYLMEIQVHSVIIKPNEELEPFIHTQPLIPLYGVFQSFKSSTKPYKVDRETTSPCILNRTSRMLLRKMVDIFVMVDVAQGRNWRMALEHDALFYPSRVNPSSRVVFLFHF